MTKPWDLHKATIKTLYAEHTLAEVRAIMMDKYNFKASKEEEKERRKEGRKDRLIEQDRTRAYRGRLIQWGVRKYTSRKHGDAASVSGASRDGGASDTASREGDGASVTSRDE
ncbi:hypothetical protein EKO27_g10363 [Xylaria grammica]|uniref:Clr5 domain-containing protein n=1 Tax=Xylaria grammica TaxID=363999 RepID=A0A439CRK6_9PEZI|nr:hypothetical protein EKO27_g10363 [Xylaria grammica]